jgi:hypothetical protein
MAEMVIDVVAATELLHQAAVDESRIDIAADWISRRSLESEHIGKRIEGGLEGRVERDRRIVEQAAEAI